MHGQGSTRCILQVDDEPIDASNERAAGDHIASREKNGACEEEQSFHGHSGIELSAMLSESENAMQQLR